MTSEIHKRALPVLDAAGTILVDSREKLHTITENLAATSTSLRSQVERMDHTISDVIDRTRLQVIRADEMVTRIMDRVESTSETVQHKVTSPVRHLNGLLAGVQVGVESFFRRGNRRTEGAPQDEMFI